MSTKFVNPIEMGGYAITGLGGTFGSTTALNGAMGDARYLQLASPYVDWTPAITPQTGAFGSPATVQIARYRLIGKTCLVELYFTIVNNGTGGGWVNLTLPFTSRGNMMALGGLWNVVSLFGGRTFGASNVFVLQANGGGYVGATGSIYTFNFAYEVQ